MTAPAAIRIDRHYKYPPAAVWQALTDPELVARWWAAGDVRPVVGHRFEMDMGQWGKQACEVLVVEPERLFSYRFAIGVLDTIVTWTLEPAGGGTRFSLAHEGFNLDTPLGKQAFAGMQPGWPNVLARLEMVLSG
jgi:uncharacterized protein YndB with AHSA1/START domain